MAEQPIRGPYGDIFFIETPYLDRASEILYQEQKQRKAQQQQAAASLNKMLSDDLGKIRSVDQTDYINVYEQWKNAQKKLLFDPQVKKDPYSYNAAQQQAQQLFSRMKTLGSQSAELKNQFKTLGEGYLKNPDAYRDDAADLISVANKTPLSAGGRVPYGNETVDLFNLGTYPYAGTNTDFGKLEKEAAGALKPTGYTETKPMDKAGIQFMITPYEFGNSPAQYKNHLLGAYAQRRAGRDASYMLRNIPQAEREEIVKMYNEIPVSKLKKMGISERQDLTPANPDNDADVLSSLQAMRYAINNEARAGKASPFTNQSEMEALRQRNRKEMAAISKGNQEALIRLRQRMRGTSQQDKNTWLDEFVGDLESRSKGNIRKYKTKDGQEFDTYKMEVSPQIYQALGFNKDNMPDELRFAPNGDIMYITYQRYGKDDKKRSGQIKEGAGGRRAVDAEFSGRLSRPEFKAAIGKELLGIKAMNAALDAEGDFEEEEEITIPSSRPVSTPKQLIRAEDTRKKYDY